MRRSGVRLPSAPPGSFVRLGSEAALRIERVLVYALEQGLLKDPGVYDQDKLRSIGSSALDPLWRPVAESPASAHPRRMYVLGPGIKGTPRQWALPDRVFFAAGACQVLAFAALEELAGEGFSAKWIRPAAGFRGNHIIVTDGRAAFDYHGWSRLEGLLAHTRRKAERWWPGWSCQVLDFATPALVSESASKALGLHLREPGQFTHDALPRARAFFARYGRSRGCLHQER